MPAKVNSVTIKQINGIQHALNFYLFGVQKDAQSTSEEYMYCWKLR